MEFFLYALFDGSNIFSSGGSGALRYEAREIREIRVEPAFSNTREARGIFLQNGGFSLLISIGVH